MTQLNVESLSCYRRGAALLLKDFCIDDNFLLQAGRPKTISGFQTHNTPVLLSRGERAELATQKYLAVNPVLEGIVILQENPDYIDSQE